MALGKGLSMNEFPELSVIIIARNEAQNIARAIESILCTVENHPRTEILLVDSASTDDTVEIAKRYPINIVRLDPSWNLSAAAGRYIGTCYSNGDLILYLDGDMELDPEWLDHSIPFALEHPQVAVVGGYRRDVYIEKGQIVSEVDWGQSSQGYAMDVKYIGGAMLCRRLALQEVGGFQPYLKSEEEVDLCMRLRYAGYKLVRLPYYICRHYCIPLESVASSQRRFRLNLWLGYGQVPRYYLGTPMILTYLFERGTFIVPLVGILLSLAIFFLTFFTGNAAFLGIWLLFIGITILTFAIRKHSLRRALLSFLNRILIAYSAVIGFFMIPRLRSEYPTDAELVQVLDCNFRFDHSITRNKKWCKLRV